MPVAAVRPKPHDLLRIPQIVSALSEERNLTSKGIAFTVTGSRREGAALVVGIERTRGRRSTAIEEGLEGCRAVWGSELENRGEVFLVDPDAGEVALRFVTGAPPLNGERILLYQIDFLGPLLELWQTPERAEKAIKATSEKDAREVYPSKPLPKGFSDLRERQKDAVDASLHKYALIVGPPGTGKTFTAGAIIAHLLTRFKDSRILLVGPTNVAVDTLLHSTDDWLERLQKLDLRKSLKRIGSRFDARKYKDRPHLLAPGIDEAAKRVVMLELEEPPRSNVSKYLEWKEELDRARAVLKTDVRSVAQTARLVGVTTASLFIWNEAIAAAGPWHFVVCDEASQVSAPAALMLTTFARQAIFSGDPHQLAPVVQSDAQETRDILSMTAFQAVRGAKSVQLNEQSRMSHAICDAVGNTFYGGDLIVCRKARKNKEWKSARSPYLIGGREVPGIMFDDQADGPTWSNKYNGLIRFTSAELVSDYVAEFLGIYVDAKDILVLTPFRAQRALIRTFFKGDSLREVPVRTVHKSQGSESKIVIFDPVDAKGAFLNSEDGKRLINVALSRAQAHAIVIVNDSDMENRWLRQLRSRSEALWHTKGDYASPFFVRRRRYK